MPKMEVIRKYFFSQTELRVGVKLTHFNSRHLYIDLENEFDVLLLTPTFKPAEETPLVPIWVVLPKLPWHYYCLEILEPLLSPIGEVLFLDLATYMKNRGSVAKIKIQIDLTQKRPQHVWMGYDEDENMEERRQSVQDKEVLDYCNYCKHHGHTSVTCTFKIRDEENRKRKEEAEK